MPSLELSPGESLLLRFKSRVSRPKLGKCQVYVTSQRMCWFKKSLVSSREAGSTNSGKAESAEIRPPTMQTRHANMAKFFFSKPQYMFKINLDKGAAASTPHSELIFKLSGDADVKERQFEDLKALLTDLLAQNQLPEHVGDGGEGPGTKAPPSAAASGAPETAVVRNARKRARLSAASRVDATMQNAQPSSSSSASVQHKAGEDHLAVPLSFAERRAALFSKPDLQRSHEELVLSGAMNEEEFWRMFQEQQAAAANTDNTSEGRAASQLTGQPGSGATAPNEPERIRLDVATIRSIFVKNPKVFERYQRKVPGEMTESEFWSEYFHAVAFRSTSIAHGGGTGSLRTAISAAAAAAAATADNESSTNDGTGSENTSTVPKEVSSDAHDNNGTTGGGDSEDPPPFFDPRFDLRETDGDVMLPIRQRLQSSESTVSSSGKSKATKSKKSRKRGSSAILDSLNSISSMSLAQRPSRKEQRDRLNAQHIFSPRGAELIDKPQMSRRMLHFQRRATLSDDSDNEDEAFKNDPTLENSHRDVLDAALAASTLARITSQLDPVYQKYRTAKAKSKRPSRFGTNPFDLLAARTREASLMGASTPELLTRCELHVRRELRDITPRLGATLRHLYGLHSVQADARHRSIPQQYLDDKRRSLLSQLREQIETVKALQANLFSTYVTNFQEEVQSSSHSGNHPSEGVVIDLLDDADQEHGRVEAAREDSVGKQGTRKSNELAIRAFDTVLGQLQHALALTQDDSGTGA